MQIIVRNNNQDVTVKKYIGPGCHYIGPRNIVLGQATWPNRMAHEMEPYFPSPPSSLCVILLNLIMDFVMTLEVDQQGLNHQFSLEKNPSSYSAT